MIFFFKLGFFKKLFFLNSLFYLILTKFFFRIFKFKTLLSITNKICDFNKLFFYKNDYINVDELFLIHLKISDKLKNISCFQRCIAAKISFSFIGVDIKIVNGIIQMENKFKVKGHSWLEYKSRAITSKNEDISDYIESFRI